MRDTITLNILDNDYNMNITQLKTQLTVESIS